MQDLDYITSNRPVSDWSEVIAGNFFGIDVFLANSIYVDIGKPKVRKQLLEELMVAQALCYDRSMPAGEVIEGLNYHRGELLRQNPHWFSGSPVKKHSPVASAKTDVQLVAVLNLAYNTGNFKKQYSDGLVNKKIRDTLGK